MSGLSLLWKDWPPLYGSPAGSPPNKSVCWRHLQVNYQNFIDLPFAELIKKYQECDMVTFCSTLEGFACPGLPRSRNTEKIDRGAFNNVLTDRGACYVDPFKVDSIRKGILKVIEDQDFRDRLVQAGLENVKRFEQEVIAEQYLEVYRKV